MLAFKKKQDILKIIWKIKLFTQTVDRVICNEEKLYYIRNKSKIEVFWVVVSDFLTLLYIYYTFLKYTYICAKLTVISLIG